MVFEFGCLVLMLLLVERALNLILTYAELMHI